MLLNSIIKRFWQILGQPRYTLSASTGSVNEGSSVTFTLNTRRIRTGTVLYYTLTGSNITSTDISGGALSGSFTITNGTGSVTITMANDLTTEGNETLTFQVRTGSTSGPIEAATSVTINDTSTAPSETYTITLNNPSSGQLNVEEGYLLSFNVSISGWDGNATRFWTAGGPIAPGGDGSTPDADAADFSPSNGSFTVSGTPGGAATGTIQLATTIDATTEGLQDYTLAVRTGSTSGPVVGIAQQVVGGQQFGYITDTSTPGRFVQVMIVGGGGAGGHDAGGGGGGGGMIDGSWYYPTGVAQQIVLGAGGARTTGAGNTGTASRVGVLVANGGGGGASVFGTGIAGGSGGGGGHKGGAGGNGTAGFTLNGTVQGYKGGGWGDYCTGGGGGGAGSSSGGGGNWNVNVSNNRQGGAGRISTMAQPVIAALGFSGGGGGGSHCTATTFALGGAGQAAPVVTPNYYGAGRGGGGWQVCPANLATPGTALTGGGGGGNGNLGCNGIGGVGGSGMIWIRTPSINAAGVTFTPGVTRTTFPSVNGTTVFRITATTASQTVTFT